MSGTYELRIKTAVGSELYRLASNPGGQDVTKSGFIELAYTNQVNDYGLCAFTLPGNHSILPNLTERIQVEVWRADPANGVAQTMDWSGLLLDEERWYDESSKQHFYKAICYSDVFKLTDRVNLWKANVANRSTFTNVKAETILKTLGTYNFTSSASVANGRIVDGTMAGVSIQTDGATGNTISIDCAWDKVLETLQKIANIGGGDFDLIKTGANTWELRWYLGQRGTDRRSTVTFSTDLGNMGNPKYTKKRSGKKTSVTVGGQGLENARLIRNRTGNSYSVTNNFEEFFNGSSQAATNDALDAIGDGRLFNVRDNESLDFDILPTPACVYNKHWFLGDLVTSKYLNISFTPKIIGTSVSVDKSGQDHIKAEMFYVR